LVKFTYREECVSDDCCPGVSGVSCFLEGSEQLRFQNTSLFVEELDGVLSRWVPSLALTDNYIESWVTFHVDHQSHCFTDLHESVSWLSEWSTSDLKINILSSSSRQNDRYFLAGIIKFSNVTYCHQELFVHGDFEHYDYLNLMKKLSWLQNHQQMKILCLCSQYQSHLPLLYFALDVVADVMSSSDRFACPTFLQANTEDHSSTCMSYLQYQIQHKN